MFMLDPIYLLTHGEANLGGKCPPYSQRDTVNSPVRDMRLYYLPSVEHWHESTKAKGHCP